MLRAFLKIRLIYSEPNPGSFHFLSLTKGNEGRQLVFLRRVDLKSNWCVAEPENTDLLLLAQLPIK